MSIYVPDATYDELRRRELPISRLAQQAFKAALRDDANREWIARARERPTISSSLTTEELMAAVDEDFGS